MGADGPPLSLSLLFGQMCFLNEFRFATKGKKGLENPQECERETRESHSTQKPLCFAEGKACVCVYVGGRETPKRAISLASRGQNQAERWDLGCLGPLELGTEGADGPKCRVSRVF